MSDVRTGHKTTAACPEASIRIKSVSKHFGKVLALDSVDLNVNPGIVFALLGPNGSGKTTLVRILTTLLIPDSGSAEVGGFDVVKNPDSVRPIMGLAGQYPAVDENLSGLENLEMIGRLYHLGSRPARQRAIELLQTFDLTDAVNRTAKTYSGGMRRRLDLAAALVANPSILFLDEPTTGLDPRSRLRLWDVISDQARNCSTVFLTTQYLEEADRLASQIAIMDRGKVLRVGPPQELKDCCGGETHVRLRLVNRSEVSRAIEALKDLGGDKIYSDPATGEISLPALTGTVLLGEVVRRMDSALIQVAEVGLKQPTLDDVFLALTGHTTEEEPSNLNNAKTLRKQAD
jgi:ABC-2 type transport system ATP-binding protein